MYDLLTIKELTSLQSMLYQGTEEAFRIARRDCRDPRWAEQCRGTHREIAVLFIEVGTELVRRLEPQLAAA